MSWETLSAAPLAFVRPTVIQHCLQACAQPWRETLAGHPRFRQRVEALLMDAHGLLPLSQLPLPDEDTLVVLRLARARLAYLGRFCGAIWHSSTLAREVRGDAQRYLREHLGASLYTQALARRELAGAPDLLREPAALMEAIDQDGVGCLAAWMAQRPAPLRAWLALRLDIPDAAMSAAVPDTNLVAVAARALLDDPEVTA